MGDCQLLPAPTIPRSLGWCPSSTALAFVPLGPQLDSGSKVPAAGLSRPRLGGGAEVRPDTRVSSHSAARAGRRGPRKATGYSGAGLWAVGVAGWGTRPPHPEKPRECGYSSGSPQPRESRPQSCPVLARPSRPRGRAAAGRSARPGCSAPTQAPRRGSRVRPPPPACRCPTAMPRPERPGPARP